jgi:multiple sugar transport system substrate-binding protein
MFSSTRPSQRRRSWRSQATGVAVSGLAIALVIAGCSSSKGSKASQTGAASSPTSSTPSSAASTTTGGGAASSPAAPAGSTQSSGPGVDDGTKLTLWTRAATQVQSKQLADAYNATHKNQVELTVVPTDSYAPKVAAAAGAGGLPDMFASDVVFAPNYVAQGLYQDLTAEIDALPFKASLAPSAITSGVLKGKEYVIPHVMDLSVLFYNKDLFTKAGLDPNKPPATLAEFASDATAISKLGKGIYGTFFGGDCGGCLEFTWWPTAWADVQEVMNADGTAGNFASPEMKSIYKIYRGLVEAGVTEPSTKTETGATWTGLFPKGNIGIMPMPSSTLGSMPAGMNIGVAPIPGVDGGQSTFVGGDSIGVSKDSKHLQQAWNFLAWTVGDYAQVEVVAKNHEVMARADLANNKYTSGDPRVVLINSLIGKGRTPFALQTNAAINDPNGPWLALVRDAIFGDASKIDADNNAITKALAEPATG